MLNDRPIGMFDSGLGGLTVASALHKRLPGENIIYLGDTARVPYGAKSPQVIKRYALECALFLLNYEVKVIVAACNTVSAVALLMLKGLLRVPIIGVLEPGVEAGLRATKSNRIGVIGTQSTIVSGAYQNRLKELRPDVKVWGKPCPLFVPLVEEGRISGSIVRQIAKNYLAPLKRHSIDTLILGCTHYPLLEPVIAEVMGEEVVLVDSAETTAMAVEDTLLRESLLRTYGVGEVICFVTDFSQNFKKQAQSFFRQPITKISQVNLGL